MAEDKSGNAHNYVTVEIYDQIHHLSGQNVNHVRELAARALSLAMIWQLDP